MYLLRFPTETSRTFSFQLSCLMGQMKLYLKVEKNNIEKKDSHFIKNTDGKIFYGF